MPLLDLMFSMFIFFLWIAWIVLVIRVFFDIFRNDLSGWSKALWALLTLALPFIGVLFYLGVHGDDMAQRQVQDVAAQDESMRAYIRQAAGSGKASTADELEKLHGLHAKGVLDDAEYASQKAKLLA